MLCASGHMQPGLPTHSLHRLRSGTGGAFFTTSPLRGPMTTQLHETLDMSAASSWPQWLDAARVPDQTVAAAYDGTPASGRAAIKTGLALARQYFGLPVQQEERRWRDSLSGFWLDMSRRPAPWAIVAFTPAYAAAARLAAACIPALLTQVPMLAAVCVGSAAPTPQALVALELCGVEDIFQTDEAEICRLLEEIPTGPGRLVLLHKGELDMIGQTARSLQIPLFEETVAPSLALPHPEIFDMDALVLAHGAGCIKRALTAALPEVPSAIYTTPEAARAHCRLADDRPFNLMAPLALTPGCEGFWLHTGLSPAFFTLRRGAFGLL